MWFSFSRRGEWKEKKQPYTVDETIDAPCALSVAFKLRKRKQWDTQWQW